MSEVCLYPRDDEGNEGIGFPVDYNVDVSLDAVLWKTVATRRDVNPGEEVQTVKFKLAKARYVRIVGTTLRRDPVSKQCSMQIVELEVY